MRHLLNTLFITSEDAYLSLEGENVLVNREKIVVARFPLHTLSGILSFSYAVASPALMGACAKTGHQPGVLFSQRKVFGSDSRDHRWQCAASSAAISGGR